MRAGSCACARYSNPGSSSYTRGTLVPRVGCLCRLARGAAALVRPRPAGGSSEAIQSPQRKLAAICGYIYAPECLYTRWGGFGRVCSSLWSRKRSCTHLSHKTPP